MKRIKKNAGTKPSSISNRNPEYTAAIQAVKNYYALDDKSRILTRPPFDYSIITSIDVIAELENTQFHKCAYCEDLIIGEARNVVSHYRPLSNAVIDTDGVNEIFDHYAWFAYEWQNLMLICPECNQYKLNKFPLSGAVVKPFSTWRYAENREKPLLLNPFTDVVEKHIKYDAAGHAEGITDRGSITIDILNLNRSNLKHERHAAIQDALNKIEDARTFKFSLQEEMLSDILAEEKLYVGAISSLLRWVCEFLNKPNPRYRRYRGLSLIDFILVMLRDRPSNEWQSAVNRASHLDLEFALNNNILAGFDSTRFAYLSGISIKGFKAISSCSIEFGIKTVDRSSQFAPCTMLLGENGAGKSSILQAIALATMHADVRRRAGVVMSDLLPIYTPNSRGWAEEFSIRIELSDGQFSKLSYSNGRLQLIGRPIENLLGYGARRYFVTGSKKEIDISRNRSLFKESASIQDPTPWLLTASNQKFEAVARALHSLLTLGVEEFIVRDLDEIYVHYPNGRIPVRYLSDGYKSIFALAVDIMRGLLDEHQSLEFAQGTVLIDEIENHLHPSWKKKLLASLRSAMPKVQFIASTHDPLCLRGMRDGEVKALYRSVDGDISIVQDLPPISTLSLEQILTSEYFGLASTEDDDQLSAANILSKYVSRSDDSMTDEEKAERDNALLDYSGTSTIGNSVDRQVMAEALGRHVKKYEKQNFFDKTVTRRDSVRLIMEVLERSMRRD
ncbi:AAA ATPase [Pseudomonas syringae pv. philadelphi]|uniref:AAA ATPase n=1 Tax=Pseudomonas syringae pv. philadelphi TaxID=251706 RepID=A0A3M3YV41_9PSED|nr:AAA family ATPase [Pseudomonas syringae group genomosp. 3]RMO85545.1 AAA ATPase [Pseudomonas syringae pv. philadelphi]